MSRRNMQLAVSAVAACILAASAMAAAPQALQFSRRAPQLGDQVEQSLSVEMQLDSVVRQGSQVVEQVKTAIGRRQHRTVTTTEVVNGMPIAALVRYRDATKSLAAGTSAADLREMHQSPQPVAGKAYRCRREGDDLRITDEAGHIPPLDEYHIVAQNMESLGRPNPLAEFLAGRTVQVGERLAVPHEVAEKLLGLGNTLGEVSRFDLLLVDVREQDGAACGVFQAGIEAASTDSSQMRLAVDGQLVIQADTCRAVEANFAGPIGMSETRGSLTATYQMTGTGRMAIRIAAAYSDVAR